MIRHLQLQPQQQTTFCATFSSCQLQGCKKRRFYQDWERIKEKDRKKASRDKEKGRVEHVQGTGIPNLWYIRNNQGKISENIKVLESIIDPSQTAYVPGRSVADNLRSNFFYKNYCCQNNVDAVLILWIPKKPLTQLIANILSKL